MANVNPVKIAKKRNAGGFSLLEIMIALAVISIGLLGTAALITGIIKGNQISKKITIATTLAQDRVEYLASLSYSDLPSSGTEDYGEITDYPKFKRVTNTYVNDPAPNMKRIEIEVYKEGTANPVVTFQNIYAK